MGHIIGVEHKSDEEKRLRPCKSSEEDIEAQQKLRRRIIHSACTKSITERQKRQQRWPRPRLDKQLMEPVLCELLRKPEILELNCSHQGMTNLPQQKHGTNNTKKPSENSSTSESPTRSINEDALAIYDGKGIARIEKSLFTSTDE